ncbi:MAG: hypothetical protein IPN94_23180 [Sphingobacteriales bacterium]|nr:hypothetical protein [Sphingobacteriales bacterium]
MHTAPKATYSCCRRSEKYAPMMYLALSYDPLVSLMRRGAVSFLVRIKQLLEDPIKLFLDI